jgi:hypothetical protein
MLNKKVLYSASAFLTLLIGYVYVDKFHPNIFNSKEEATEQPINDEVLEEDSKIEEEDDSLDKIEEKVEQPKIEEKDEFPKREKAPERRKRIQKRSQISTRTVS